MTATDLNAILQQIQSLDAEGKWQLLSLLIEELRGQAGPAARRLDDYYGVGKGRGLATAREVDARIAEERASWPK